MKGQQIERSLRRWALDTGFDLAGIAKLDRAENGRHLLEWLAAGRQAQMAYLERRVEVRLDPRSIFPGARSALCVALSYHRPESTRENRNDLWPGVARYAYGDDYHRVMERMLKSLAARIVEEFPGNETRWYVDTGPVLEKELAAAAGLGAIGKNTNLLNADHGSWLLLAEIFTSLDLESEPQVADLCGSCTACLDACPTGALTGAYQLDANRCISYWTIEHRGPLPAEIRPQLGEWVFGCDVCQEVCPANAEPPPAKRKRLPYPSNAPLLT